MKNIILKIFKFELMQYKFGRMYIGGNFYYQSFSISVGNFWSDCMIKSCQGRILKTEKYEK